MNGLQHIEYYSDLPEPVPHSDLPETIARRLTGQAEKERRLPAHHGPSYEEKEASQGQQNVKNAQESHRTSRRRRCGLAPCPFWSLVAAVVVMIIVAAVAGGIVGSQSQKNEKTAPAGAAADGPPPSTNAIKTGNTATSGSATPTSSSGTSLTTTTLHVGSRTLYRDCPSSNNTVYSYGSSSSPMLFRKWCGMSCWNINGWAAMINQDTNSLDDCIDLCASYNLQTNIGHPNSSKFCDSVCWRWSPQDPDFPGHCFGYQTVNVTGHFNVSMESDCDSAGWMNPYS